MFLSCNKTLSINFGIVSCLFFLFLLIDPALLELNVSYLWYPFRKQHNFAEKLNLRKIIMDYEEEQRNEIEALESIYFNELNGKEGCESC